MEPYVDIDILNSSPVQEKSLEMGDEVPLDVSWAVDPYWIHPHGI